MEDHCTYYGEWGQTVEHLKEEKKEPGKITPARKPRKREKAKIDNTKTPSSGRITNFFKKKERRQSTIEDNPCKS